MTNPPPMTDDLVGRLRLRREHGDMMYSRMLLVNPDGDEAAARIEALEAEKADMAWFSTQRRLSLDFYSPMYGDDDDQSEEWRVTQESGSINDREWDVIGRGDTVFAAVAAARAALTLEPPHAD